MLSKVQALSYFSRFPWPTFWWIFSVSVISFAVVLILGRFLLPMVGNYREEITNWVSDTLGQEVHISDLELEWQGIRPVLRLRGINIAGYGGINIDAIAFTLDVAASLHEFRLIPAELFLLRPRLMLGSESLEKSNVKTFPLGPWKLGRSQIVAHDAQFCFSFGCFSGNGHLRSDGKRIQGEADLHLPFSWGNTAHLVLNANHTKSHGWKVEWYLETKELRLAPLVHLLYPEIMVDGDGDSRLWGTWDHTGLIRLEGIIDRLLVRGNHPHHLKLALEHFSWARKNDGWQLNLSTLHQQDTPGTQISLRFDSVAELQVTNLALEKLAFLANIEGILPKKIAETIAILTPRGQLQELRLYLSLESFTEPSKHEKDSLLSIQKKILDLDGWKKLEGQANFIGLAFQPWKSIPGVEGLDGEVRISNGIASIEFNEHQGKIYFSNLFAAPWNVDYLTTQVSFQHDITTGWHWEMPKFLLTTPDLSLEAGGTLLMPPGTSPRLDLEATILHADASQLSIYLPRHVMPPPSVIWLDHSILGGNVSQGTVKFHGNLDDFPFDRGEGIFEVTCQVTNGELNYDSDWPAIRALDANITFRGRSMEIQAKNGRILDSTLTETTAIIPDLDQKSPLLRLRGQVQGPMADIPRLIRESPLSRRHGQYVNTLDGRGAMLLTLELDMHVRPPVKVTHLAGRLNLRDADLHWRDPEISVNAASGTLEFFEDGIRSQGISARIFDLPVKLALQSKSVAGKPITEIEVHGQFEPASAPLPLSLLNRLRGQTTWQATVTLPEIQPGGKIIPLIHLESDLQGLALDLPIPFDKSANQTQILRVEINLKNQSQPKLHVSYGALVNAILELDENDFPTQGEIYLGKATVAMDLASRRKVLQENKNEKRFYLHGDFTEIVLDDWLDLVSNFTKGGNANNNSVTNLVFDIQVGVLKTGGYHFHEANFFVSSNKRGWEAKFNTRETAGRLQWSAGGVNVDLDRLLLTENESNEKDPVKPKKDHKNNSTSLHINPRHLPPLHLRCTDLRLELPLNPPEEKNGEEQGSLVDNRKKDEISLGRLEIITQPNHEGLNVTNLELQSQILYVNGKGLWRSDINENQSSRFDFDLTTNNLGRALNTLGYLGTVEAGPGKAKFHAEWNGSPLDFSVENLDGSLELEVDKGRLLQVSPGRTGRIFGLLSLQELPRRLALDFSDVFRKGLAFDRIQGDFRIRQGNAYSKNLTLRGPAAEITMAGRTGLAEQDYEQEVTVTPNVDMTLPVAGALITGSGVGVGVGAAILLAQHLLQPGIHRITQARYTLRGTWGDPLLEPFPMENTKENTETPAN